MLNDIEKQVLANLVHTPDNIKLLESRGINKEYFLFPDCQKLFVIFAYHYENYGLSLESDSLQLLLKQSQAISEDQQKRIGILFEEIKGIPVSSNFDLLLTEFISYFKIQSIARLLDKAAGKVSDKNPDQAISDLKSGVISLVKALEPPTVSKISVGENADAVIAEYFDRKQHPEKYQGISIGFPSFDRATGGLMKGTVTLVMGQMKSAKSVLMTNIMRNVFQNGKRVYYHVNEGGQRLVVNRFMSCHLELPYNSIRNCNMNADEETKYIQFLQGLKGNPNINIESVMPANSTAEYIDRKIQELNENGPVDLVLVDYLGLMTSPAKNIDSDWKKWGQIALELKSIAMDRQVPIIALTHVNRKGMESESGKNFDLSDFGLSIEPLKHVDLICSWRIQDHESFKLTHKGTGKLAIMGARDSEEPEVSLDVNTNMMKIGEHVMTIAH